MPNKLRFLTQTLATPIGELVLISDGRMVACEQRIGQITTNACAGCSRAITEQIPSR